MDNLPAKKDLHYIWNNRTRKFDVLDLSTGRYLEPVTFEPNPTEASELMMDVICDQIREGKTLQQVCSDPNMPSASRFYMWLAQYPDLRVRYEQARKQRADRFHDMALDIALAIPNKDMVPGAKLAVDTLKWAAEKANPEAYGKKEADGPKGTSISITLHTGVLDAQQPADIIVDEFGNFKGFANNEENIVESITVESTIGTPKEIIRDRFASVDDTIEEE